MAPGKNAGHGLNNKVWTTLSLFVLVALSICRCESASGHTQISLSRSTLTSKLAFVSSKSLVVRGGSSDYDDEYDDEYENEDDDDESSSDVTEGIASSEGVSVFGISKRALILVGKITKALNRALVAGFSTSEEQEEDVGIIQRMWNAAMNPSKSSPEGGGLDPIASSSKVKVRKSKSDQSSAVSHVPDKETEELRRYLSSAYGVTGETADKEEQSAIRGGTFTDALREARSQARLLVVFIPSSKPGRGKKGTSDKIAIKSLLSNEVSAVAEKKARKKVKSGSFVFWAAKAGSAEASASTKRLKVKPAKGQKRPTLIVVYPAQAVGSGGLPKIVPQVLSQHHCNPPPNSEKMAVWLNTLRKRHAKQYASMQLEKQEMEYFKERQKGYASSVESDLQREEDEKNAELERLAKEKEEKKRLEEMKSRRKELKESLPEEPDKDIEGVMTIALRFTDGNSGRRRFAPDTPVSVLFNWVDAMFEMERETVVLTTMNGKKTFNWDDDDETILSDTGLGKMTGLRVSQKEAEEDGEDGEIEGEEDE
mmetsp:Transcript_16391/g.23121  ORF Transcript_16391/g.23121 Transcript_16391/m.23121 type:complete len:539 (+) Transcript_16391:95-1711(+)